MIDWRCGNNIRVMRSLPAGSIQCVVTSPPYFGLRDYGTGQWVGGDSKCKHRPKISAKSLAASTLGGGKKTTAHQQEALGGRVCPHCGAIHMNEIWGGDRKCQHVWGGTRSVADGNAPSRKTTLGGGKDKIRSQSTETTTGAFCLKCNAWQGELGNEPTPEFYIEHLVWVFRAVKRVLRDDGTLWLNIGDCFARDPGKGISGDGKNARHLKGRENTRQTTRNIPAGVKQKDLLGIPWMLAFALRDDGWYLRSEVIWSKVNGLPESCTDRPTKMHEQIFLLTKQPNYTFYQDAVREPCVSKPGGAVFGKISATDAAHAAGSQARRQTKEDRERYITQGRNLRSVWEIPTESQCSSTSTVSWNRVEKDELASLLGGARDGAACDIRRITCKGCLLHGGSIAPVPTEQCGGCGDVSCGCHNQRNGACRVSKLKAGSVETPPNKGGPVGVRCKGGAPGREEFSANCHSRKNRKTGRVRLRLKCGSASEETFSHIGGKQQVSSGFETHGNICDRKTSPDGMDARLWGQTVFCTVDKSSLPISKKCCCVYYHRVEEITSHFAPFPQALVQRCLLASTKKGDTVLDPFGGSGTVSMVAERMGRNSVYIDLNEKYMELAKVRVLTEQTGGVHRRPVEKGFFK